MIYVAVLAVVVDMAAVALLVVVVHLFPSFYFPVSQGGRRLIPWHPLMQQWLLSFLIVSYHFLELYLFLLVRLSIQLVLFLH